MTTFRSSNRPLMVVGFVIILLLVLAALLLVGTALT